MLDQLIESRNHLNETKRRGGFLLSAFTFVFTMLAIGIVYSLFNSNFVLASQELNFSALVSPVSPPADAPEPPSPRALQPKQQSSEHSLNKIPTRMENIQRIEEPPVKAPENVSVVSSSKMARPNEPFTIGIEDSTPFSSGGNRGERTGAKSGNGENRPSGINVPTNTELIEKDAPPVIKPKIQKSEPSPQAAPIVKSEGVVNGKAINLVKPPYPLPAKEVHASGSVNVQVLIDEEGNVVSAKAVSGHPLLRQAAEQAARSSKFSPTFLSRQKVKVTGVIVYNFVAQ